MAFKLWQAGASEVYLDGKPLYKFGAVGRSEKEERNTFKDRNPKIISFSPQRRHVLAIRYSNFSATRFQRFGSSSAGFAIRLEQLDKAIEAVRQTSIRQMVFTTILVALAFVHFMLFIFYPRLRENLFYALSTLGIGGIWFTNYQMRDTISSKQVMLLDSLAQSSQVIAVVFGLLMTYALVYGRLPKRAILFVLAGLGLVLWAALDLTELFSKFKDAFTVVVVAKILWYLIRAWKRDTKGAAIIAGGFSILAVTVFYEVLKGNNIIAPIAGLYDTYIYGALAMGIAMSVFLSRRFARTNQQLEIQLEQVRELSERTLAQERQAHEAEISRRLLEADNARKTQELEEARQLQLSMLPKEIPSLANLDIAVQTKTATEVGGDYYDFLVDQNGTLTVAIGDATGHGMKAGTLVASIKSLFTAFGSSLDLRGFFNKCSEIIKGMHLGNLYMAMLLAKISGRNMTVSAAGMPPILIYRNDTGAVEEMLLKGMPLGGPYAFDYPQSETALHPGDAILFMSDGYPELFNGNDEMLDYPRIGEIFREAATKPAAAVIDHLWKAGEAWANGNPLRDDTTLLVIKVTKT